MKEGFPKTPAEYSSKQYQDINGGNELAREARESLSSEKQELLQLQESGQYVFHGTDKDIEMLEPRQAIDVYRGPDGAPAVFASQVADFAIFHALVHRGNFLNGLSGPSESGVINHPDGTFELKFGLPEGALEEMGDSATGWVYVFNRKDFEQTEGRSVEFMSHTPVLPVKKIMVSRRDLPEGIEVVGHT